MLNFHTLDKNQNNQNKKTLLTFFKIQISPRTPTVSTTITSFRYTTSKSPSETATIQKTSEFSEETVQNTRSFTKTDDSNLIQSPTHHITQNEFNNQNQDNTLTTNQDNTSVLSTSITNITQPS